MIKFLMEYVCVLNEFFKDWLNFVFCFGLINKRYGVFNFFWLVNRCVLEKVIISVL